MDVYETNYSHKTGTLRLAKFQQHTG